MEEQLRRVARIDKEVEIEEVAGSPDGLGWRTRVRFAVDRTEALALASVVVDVHVTQIVHGVAGAHAVLRDDAVT